MEKPKLSRRDFLKQTTVTAAALTAGLNPVCAGKTRRGGAGKKVIVIGLDGMDPRLSEK